MTVDARTLATAAVKGDEPQYDETLEFFLVAPQLEQNELSVQIEVRDIHMRDDVKVSPYHGASLGGVSGRAWSTVVCCSAHKPPILGKQWDQLQWTMFY